MCVCVYVCDSVVFTVDAEVEEGSVDDVAKILDRIVSQSADIPACPFGFGDQTSLVVIRRANSLDLVFTCMTLSKLEWLRSDWRIHKLRATVERLFTFLLSTPVRVKRLTWPLIDYERCLAFSRFLQGMDVNVVNTIHQVSWIAEVKLLKLNVLVGEFSTSKFSENLKPKCCT